MTISWPSSSRPATLTRALPLTPYPSHPTPHTLPLTLTLTVYYTYRSTCHSDEINDIAYPRGYAELFVTCSASDIRVWHAHTMSELLRIQVIPPLPPRHCCLALMPKCPMLPQPNAPMPQRPTAPTPQCPNAPTPQCPNAPLLQFPNAPMPQRPAPTPRPDA